MNNLLCKFIVGTLYPAEPNKSLMQMYGKLQASIEEALNKCAVRLTGWGSICGSLLDLQGGAGYVAVC